MSLKQGVCLFLLINGFALASSLPPFYAEQVLLERIFNATASPALALTALGMLEHIAEGHPDAINPVDADKLGLKGSGLQDRYLNESSVRADALHSIGETALPEALAFLSSLKPGDLEPGDSGQLERGESQIRFCESRVQVLSRDVDRVKALASVLRVDDNGEGNTALQAWAVEQLLALHRPEADRELARYSIQIDKLPEQSPERERLYSVREEIRFLKARRSRRGQ